MIYDEYLSDKVFFMKRYPNSKAISLFHWDYILSDMIFEKRIEIWKPVKHTELGRSSLCTTSTPKLRKMMRSENFRNCI